MSSSSGKRKTWEPTRIQSGRPRTSRPPSGEHATAIGLRTGPVPMALIPLAVGLLAAFVAYGRWRLAPHRPRAPR